MATNKILSNKTQQPDPEHIDLSVVIVSYNGGALLRSCLQSIYSQRTAVSFELIVVDNASAEDLSIMVSKEFPQVKYIQNDANVGFSRANNIAIREAKGSFILLLNPDTRLIDEGTFDKLVSFLESHNEAGAAGTKLVYAAGHGQVSAGYRLTPLSLFAFSFFLAKISSNRFKGFGLHPTEKTTIEPIPVDWICAACMIIRREVMESTGLLDESYFLYGEDIEWGCRMTDDGWPLYHLPDIKIEHALGGTQPDSENPSTTWLDGFNRVYFELNPGASRIYYRLVLGTGFLLRAILYGICTTVSSNPWFFNRRRDMTAWSKYVLLGPKAKASQ
ncbi:MAG: N-acetylglucosaminyl-diphospho-decaprenol L-rhamnosyltransferase [Granulosicoccus sp.]